MMATNDTKQVRDWAADRAVCDAATGREWANHDDNGSEGNVVYEYDRLTELTCDIIASCEYLADARFIAEARTGWPAALDFIQTQADEIERLQAEIRRLRDVLQFVYQHARNDVARWDGGQCVGTVTFNDRKLARDIVREMEEVSVNDESKAEN